MLLFFILPSNLNVKSRQAFLSIFPFRYETGTATIKATRLICLLATFV